MDEKEAEKMTPLIYSFISHWSYELMFDLQNDIDGITYAALKHTKTALKDIYNTVIQPFSVIDDFIIITPATI